MEKKLPPHDGVVLVRSNGNTFPRCMGTTRSTGERCRSMTQHGRSYCRMHGGAVTITHGRYSSIRNEAVKVLYEQFRDDDNLWAMDDDLAMGRAILSDFINNFDEWSAALLAWYENRDQTPPNNVMDLTNAFKGLDTISRIVERKNKADAANAVSRKDLYRILQQMGHVVALVLQGEPDLLRRVQDGWVTISL